VYVEDETFGRVLNIQTYWGEYLPNWHPWEDYRLSYAAKKEQGGGAALTLSHDLDVVNWLINSTPVTSKAIHNYSSSLDIDTDSGCDISLVYDTKATAHIHVNYHQKVAQRWYKIVFEEAVIDIDYLKSTITISTSSDVSINQLKDFDRNDMFIEELQDFFLKIESGNYKQFSRQQINNSYNIIKACINE
jgi:predicted dehydrogenase